MRALPILSYHIARMSNYAFFSKLDVKIQYTFKVDKESKNFCTIVMPFGEFKYKRLPMGLKYSPDFAQAVTENIFCDVEDANVYIYNVCALFNEWKMHLQLLDTILQGLMNNGFTVNPIKYKWGLQ